MKKGIALFDFDGTITTRDTLFELIKFQEGGFLFYIGIIWLLPVFIFLKLKLIPKKLAKEKVLSYFIANQPQETFQNTCDQFIVKTLPTILRKEALQKIEIHLKRNDRVIVVTASAYNWVGGWCQSMNIELIATRLECKNGVMTGKLASMNCNDDEKVRRIKEYLDINEFSPIYAYGNSSGDKPMLALADQPYFRKF